MTGEGGRTRLGGEPVGARQAPFDKAQGAVRWLSLLAPVVTNPNLRNDPREALALANPAAALAYVTCPSTLVPRHSSLDTSVLFVHLDDRHLADALFVQTLGRFVAGHASPLAFVHGDGGLTQRALEARGWLPGDPLPDRATDADLDAARVAAVRAQGQTLVRRLSDAGVPAVALQGSDRGLLTVGADGVVAAPRARWLAGEAGRGAIPLVGLVARTDAGGSVPVTAGAALGALTAGLAGAADVALLASLDRPSDPADPATADALRRAGIAVRVAPLTALFAPPGVVAARPEDA